MTDLFASAAPPAATSAPAPGLLAPSPVPLRLQQPRWKDGRLVAGVLLVLLSVVLGGALLNRRASTTAVVALTGDVTEGHVLTADDLTTVAVHFTDATAAGYLLDAGAVVGHRMTRSAGAGELLPVAAVSTVAAGPQRLVAVTVKGPRARLAKGDRVDVYVTRTASASAAAACAVQLVAVDVEVAVQPGTSDTPAGSEGSVLMVVDPAVVEALVGRTAVGDVTLVRHVPSGDAPTALTPSCGQVPIDGQATVAPAAVSAPAAQSSADPLAGDAASPSPAATSPAAS